MSRQPDWQRFGEGTVFTLIGLIILLLIPVQVAATPAVQTRTSPAFIPRVVALAFIVTGAAMIGVAFFGKTREKPAAFGQEGSLRVGAAMLLLFGYSTLFSTLGFVVTSGVFLAIFSYIFGARSVPRIGAAAVGVPVVVWLLFEHVFRVPLPHGLLF